MPRPRTTRWLGALALVASHATACTPATTDNTRAPTSDPATSEPGPARTRTPSGLEYVIFTGGGPVEPPTMDDRVVLRYDARDESGGWTRTTPSDAPETIAMKDLPAGWSELLAKLGPGDRAKLWVPAALGNHDAARGPTGAHVVDLALVDVLRGPAVLELPITAPPAEAIRTASGIAYVPIVVGTGKARPTKADKITAHYTGWTTDGKQFDSSYERGEPIEFSMGQVISGWGEALALMVVGDKMRFWIPQELAYKGQAGRPHGMLVFDIELVAFAPNPSFNP